MISAEVHRGLGGLEPGSAPLFLCVASMKFETIEEFQSGLQKHGEELMADVPNFTNIEPQFQISEVALQ